MEAPAAKPKTRKGKTISESKVTDLASWAKYYNKENIVVGEDGSFLVLDAALTKTDFPAALAAPVRVIPHLMGHDYITVLADPSAATELRAAAEARRTELVDSMEARVSATKVAYSEAETELLNATQRWANAPDAPSRIVLAQAVAAANTAVATAEKAMREAQAPHRYIKKYRDIPRMLLKPGSGDDRPIKNILYRLVPEATEAPERVVVAGGSHNSA
jgi:hypothetical protein